MIGRRLGYLIGLPVLGLLVAAVAPRVARWLLGLHIGLPMRPVFRLLAAVNAPWEVAGLLAGGAVVGLGFAVAAVTGAVTVTVTDAGIRLDRDGATRTIARADVAAVYLDHGRLVVLDHESRQLASETPAAPVAEALRAHGYPWQDADPYAELYRRWRSGTPDLPAAVDAVLAAREAALRKKADRDVHDLRDAVQKLGFAVRDEGARQYWRPLVRS